MEYKSIIDISVRCMMHDSRVYAKIKQRIILLEYEPGEALREKELAREFGISRTPIREALIRLETEGLVRIDPNRGIYVTEVSFQDLKDVFEIRSFLIELAGRLAAARVTDEELDMMRAHIKRMEQEEDPKILMQLDSEFHDLLNKATKNKVLVKILEMLRNQVVRIWTFSRNGCYSLFAQEFQKLIEALEKKDEDRSAHILRNHAKRFIEDMKSQL